MPTVRVVRVRVSVGVGVGARVRVRVGARVKVRFGVRVGVRVRGKVRSARACPGGDLPPRQTRVAAGVGGPSRPAARSALPARDGVRVRDGEVRVSLRQPDRAEVNQHADCELLIPNY